MFFVSGVTGLSYEVIWFKQFSHVWGTSTLAMASVVGAFLLGLGLGARVIGAYADRLTAPVYWYGLCEIGIGLSALVIPWQADLLWRLSAGIYGTLREYPVVYSLVRCATTLIAIGPPCFLMGGTLPLLVRQLARRSPVALATSWLYGVNTLGAALGCYLVGFYLLPAVGMFWTNIGAAVVNIIVGLAAVVVCRNLPTEPVNSPGTDPAQSAMTTAGAASAMRRSQRGSSEKELDTAASGLVFHRAYALAAVTGCAALVLQTVWSRQLALVLGSSTYAFSAVLLVVLVGIGVGSLLFPVLSLRYGDRSVAMTVHVVLTIIVATIIGIQLVPIAALCAGLAIPLRAGYVLNGLVCIAGSALIELLPAIAMGALFPCLVQFIRQDLGAPAKAVGTLYAWNTLGSVAGGVVTSVWIVPAWGTRLAVCGALLLYYGVALSLALGAAARLKTRVALGAVALAIAYFLYVGEDPARTNMGFFLYGYRLQEAPETVLFFREGAACNVLVSRQDQNVSIRVNGKTDGSSQGDMSMQLGLAYLPRFLNPDAQRVLVVGFGTGATPGASLLFPGTEVTCCEIEPAMVAAAPFFREVNHRPYESTDRFTVVYDDARAYIQETAEQFDLILSEPSNPWVAGVSNLFTSEFYSIVRRRLTRNGIFAQWVQTYAFAPDDYTMIVRTMRDVFPHQRLIRISHDDTILLASNDPLDRDAGVVAAAQVLVERSPEVARDLNRYFGTTEVASLLFLRMILDERGLQRLAESDGSSRRNVDRNQQLEFRAARRLYEPVTQSTDRSILRATGVDWVAARWAQLGCDKRQAGPLHELAMLFLAANQPITAKSVIDFGLAQLPETPELLADRLILSDRIDPAALERLLAGQDTAAAAAADRLGVALGAQHRFEEAAVVFSKMTERWPESATSWMNLGMSQRALGNESAAQPALERAVALDPVQEFSKPETSRRGAVVQQHSPP